MTMHDWSDAMEKIEQLQKENAVLRGLVQANKDWKCPHGQNVPTMAHCPLGFPGCNCADDILLAEDETFKTLMALKTDVVAFFEYCYVVKLEEWQKRVLRKAVKK